MKLIIQGEKRNGNPYPLNRQDKNRSLFKANQMDEFVMPTDQYVGNIKGLQLSIDDVVEPWFIESIIARDIVQAKVNSSCFLQNKTIQSNDRFSVRQRIICSLYINGLVNPKMIVNSL